MSFLPLLMRPLIWAVLAGLLLAGRASAAEDAIPPRGLTVADSVLSAGAILVGILNYTAWPGESRLLQVCISRQATEAAAILAHVEQAKSGRPLRARAVEALLPLPADCDAVYFDGWELEAQRAALRSLAAKPVLTLGRGPDFCSDGGLFCLEPAANGLRFEVNLDAVARSGLRVNPLVLRLARPRAASSS